VCGRFAFYSPAEAAAALFQFEPGLPTEPRYNIAPTQLIPVVRPAREGGRELVMLRWGLVPFWAKDPSIGNRMINARAETLAEKPAYRHAFGKRRCLILADGFYEWRTEGRGKTPYFISLDGGEPFAFAGLWESWTDRSSGESLQTAVIVTTAASAFLAELHDRMPVVLQPDTAGDWLAGEPGALDTAIAGPQRFQAWPVDRKVNDARNEGPGLLQRVGGVNGG
jgi:putative SOS response-associated peptidase YedK